MVNKVLCPQCQDVVDLLYNLLYSHILI